MLNFEKYCYNLSKTSFPTRCDREEYQRHWAKLHHSVPHPLQIPFILEFCCVDSGIHQLFGPQEYAYHCVCLGGSGINKPSCLWFPLAQLQYIETFRNILP